MRRPLQSRIVYCLSVILAGVVLWNNPLRGATLVPVSPYVRFGSLSGAQLDSVAIKFTSFSPTTTGLPSLMLRKATGPFDIHRFRRFSQLDYDYASDSNYMMDVQLETPELKAIIDSIGAITCASGGTIDSTAGVMSVAVWDTAGLNGAGYEAIINGACGERVLAAVLQATAANLTANATILDFACMTHMLRSVPLSDVTSSTQVQLTGLTRDRVSGLFVGFVKVKNTSGQSISGPISVIVRFDWSVKAANTLTVPCNRSYASMPYITVLATGALSAGQQVSQRIEILNPDKRPVVLRDWHVIRGAMQ